MRFEQLRLIAFGPFTDERLDLSGGAPGGLHVVYGPNEAGKSTSLRAVRNFLFGMPQRSPDAHLHPSAKLSVFAELSSGDERFELTRIKRRKDDLLGPDGAPLLSNPLPDLLGHLDERSFSQRFGLDQEELEKGAEALLGGSEQGLFAAGTAGADARNLLDSLRQECEQLYLQRGKVPVLNRQLAEFERAYRDFRRSERPPEKWLEQKRAHDRAKQHHAELKEQRAHVRSELRRLNRLKAVISDLSDWQRQKEQWSRLRDVPDLHADAARERERVSLALSEARLEAARFREEVQGLEAELEQLPQESTLSQVDASQLDLTSRVGRALSARKDMPKRKAQLWEVERQMALFLRDLGHSVAAGQELSRARGLLIGESVTGTVQRLLTQRGALFAEVTDAERHLAQLRQDARDLEEGAETQVDVRALELLESRIGEATELSGIDAEILRLDDEMAELASEVASLRMSLGTRVSCDVLRRELPSLEGSRAASERALTLERKRDEAERSLETLDAELRRTNGALSSKSAADLPSEERLEEARSRRDAHIESFGEVPAKQFVAQLWPLVRESDELSDRLRREADRLAEWHALAAKRDHLSRERDLARDRRADLDRRVRESHEKYSALLELWGVTAPAPIHLAGQVTADLLRLVQLEERLEVLREKTRRRRAVLDDVSSRLKALLGEEDEALGLSGLISLSRRRLRDMHQRHERARFQHEARLKLERDQEDAMSRLDEARKSFARWQKSWEKALEPLGLGAETSVERAQEVLATLERLERLVESASQYEGRIAGMQRDTEALARDVRGVAAAHLPDFDDEDPVDAAVRLQEAIAGARRVSEERSRLKGALHERRERLSEAELREETAKQKLVHLRAQAGAQSVEEIPRIEAASREKREVAARLQELEARLREAAEGTPFSELVEEARPWEGSVGRLTSEIDDLDAQNTDLEQALRVAESEVEGTRLGLDSYGSEDVALARQNAADKAAAARASLRTYLVKKAAHALLEQQVIRYAERFRGPIAGRAGELFERITLGKYQGLSIGVGQKTLRCVTEGREKEVHQLSRGTRAQLYFALRLASLEAYFQEHPPIPLIFDDLFVDFDDDRATVAFELLTEMAERTQVLYFTHLARDVEKAHDAAGGGRLFCHTIGVS